MQILCYTSFPHKTKMTIRAMAVFAIFCTATPPPQANALFGDAFDLGGDLSIGNDDNNFDFDFGGIMDGVSDMMYVVQLFILFQKKIKRIDLEKKGVGLSWGIKV